MRSLDLDPAKVAVERNLEIVPRSLHEATPLVDGDRLIVEGVEVDRLLQPIRDWAAEVPEIRCASPTDPRHRSGCSASSTVIGSNRS